MLMYGTQFHGRQKRWHLRLFPKTRHLLRTSSEISLSNTFGKMNGVDRSHATSSSGLGKAYTDRVIKSIGPKTDARLKEVMASLIRHVHDFAREVDLTFDEWMAGVEMVCLSKTSSPLSPKLKNVDQLGRPAEHKQTQRRPTPLRRDRLGIVRPLTSTSQSCS